MKTQRKYTRKVNPQLQQDIENPIQITDHIVKKGEIYTASIKVFGKTFTANGSTVKEAIENLNVGKLNKGVSVLQITHNGVSSSKILPSVQTARLFSPSKLTREVAIKNTSLRFLGI